MTSSADKSRAIDVTNSYAQAKFAAHLAQQDIPDRIRAGLLLMAASDHRDKQCSGDVQDDVVNGGTHTNELPGQVLLPHPLGLGQHPPCAQSASFPDAGIGREAGSPHFVAAAPFASPAAASSTLEVLPRAEVARVAHTIARASTRSTHDCARVATRSRAPARSAPAIARASTRSKRSTHVLRARSSQDRARQHA